MPRVAAVPASLRASDNGRFDPNEDHVQAPTVALAAA